MAAGVRPCCSCWGKTAAGEGCLPDMGPGVAAQDCLPGWLNTAQFAVGLAHI